MRPYVSVINFALVTEQRSNNKFPANTMETAQRAENQALLVRSSAYLLTKRAGDTRAAIISPLHRRYVAPYNAIKERVINYERTPVL